MVNAIDSPAFLDTVQGELAFFRGVAHARPAGAHRFFHVISIRSAIRAETGQEVSIDELWAKLGKYYDLQYFDNNEVDPTDVEYYSQDPDIAAPSLNSSASAASDSEVADTDAFPRKKQRRNSRDDSSSAPSPVSPSPNKNNGAENGDHLRGGNAVNYNVHPHFRSEFGLPAQEFHTLMYQRALRTDGVDSSSGNSPEPASAMTTKAAGRKGRPSKKAQQLAKAEDNTSVEILEDHSEGSAPVVAVAAGDEGEPEDSGSPQLSSKGKAGANRRSRTRSVGNSAKPKQQPAPFGGADSDSSLSEPDEGEEEEVVKAEDDEQEEEVVESIFSVTPAAQSEDEAPSLQGRNTTRSKRKEREPTVESLASVTRSATSKRAAAAHSKAKKPPPKKKK